MSDSTFVVRVPQTGLYRAPDNRSPLETESLYGERVRVESVSDGWAKVVTELDNYPGYTYHANLLAAHQMPDPTHMVSEPVISVHREPDFHVSSSEDRLLSMNARVCVTDSHETPAGAMVRLHGLGWVYLRELRPIDVWADDFVTEAMKFLRTPLYKWGWRSRGVVDCSALIQAGCIAANRPCPRDVSQQVEALGNPFDFAPDFSNLVRGDLVFWTKDKGSHVAVMLDSANALHATIKPPYGRTIVQPLEELIHDQAKDENGPVTSVRRFPDYRPA